MRFPTSLLYRLRWVHLPAALLITLLQRTPVLRALASAGEQLAASSAGQLVRSVFTLAALGALHSRAGATTFVQTPANPVSGTVGTPLSVAFTYAGTPSPPQYFAITGQLPPGLAFIPAARNGVVQPSPQGFVTISGTPTQAGSFTGNVQGFGLAGNGTPQPINFIITGGATTSPPTFTTHPASQVVNVGAAVTLSVAASGSPAPAYQWRKDGAAVAGATNATLTIASAQVEHAGVYTVVASNSAGSATSDTANLTIVPVAGPITARLSNLSVRTVLGAGQNLIVGFVVAGGSRDVLVRAAGPALTALGLGGAMSDPRLELFRDSTAIFSNDNWQASLMPAFDAVGAFGFPLGSADAAFVQGIDGAVSAHARGTGAGIVLVEAYDTGSGNDARLVNLSARNFVGTGDEILIAGFAVDGTGAKRLLIRAAGPALAGFGLTGVLADPIVELYDSAGTKLTENDNWSPDLNAAFTSVGAFSFVAGSRDSALVATLNAGATYTVLVRGAGNTTGEALVEVYELP